MAVIEIEKASRWFGHVVAVNDVTMRIGPGVTGLLGPNGAGKSTLMALMAGFDAPSSGTVRVDGQKVRGNPTIYRRLGMVPETESSYDELTGQELVTALARLHGLSDPRAATARAIELVDMSAAQDRRIKTYSKGMRQRIKLAASLVHDPEVLLLDEPFNGMDPGQRVRLMATLHEYAAAGATVLVSSHILEEVQELAGHIEVMVSGRHLASGDFRSLRALMTHRPHVYEVLSSDDRALAAAVMGRSGVAGVRLEPSPSPHLEITVSDFTAFSRSLPLLARDLGVHLRQVRPLDESLESVFAYLVDPDGARR